MIASANLISHVYKPTQAVIKVLNNKTIYIKADMSTDADGSPRATQIDPGNGQPGTSLSKDNGWKGEGKFVNAETIPYFVLPIRFKSVSRIECKLGDVALIRFNGKEVFAIFADSGPPDEIGEGSIKTVETLGKNPWNQAKTKIISGIGFGVEYLVLPRSSETFGIPKTFDEIQTAGKKALDSVFGNGTLTQDFSMTSEEMQEKFKEGDISVFEIMNAPEFKTLTNLNLRNGVGINSERITVIPSGTIVKTAVVVNNETVKNVGANEKGLWLMVKFQNQTGFVRGSLELLLPWHQNAIDNPIN